MSDLTIDKLAIEVDANASSATKGIDALASSLGKLKTATKGGVGLNGVSKQLSNLNVSLGAISDNKTNKLSRLADAVSKLASASQQKISPSTATQISRLGQALSGIDGNRAQSLKQVYNALVPLSNIKRPNLSTFNNQLERLPKVIEGLERANIGTLSVKVNELVHALSGMSGLSSNKAGSFLKSLSSLPDIMHKLDNVDLHKLYNQIQSVTRIIRPLANEMQKVANGFAAFPSNIQRMVASSNRLAISNRGVANSYGRMALKGGAFLYTAHLIGNSIGRAVTQSNKYVEDLNLFTAAMGEYANEAQRFADKASDLLGIDPAEFMRNQGIFMTITEGFGVASDRAYIMSKNLTQLGYDLSSFYNISFADAMQKLQSGISGELEPLRRLGYDLSVARLQQEAYTLGINKKVTAMTQAEKSELRYHAIMTQVTVAQGDMARTLNAPANQLRILQAQVIQASRAIGNVFIPILNAVLPVAIAVAKAIRLIADIIARLFGFKLPEIDYSGLRKTGNAVGGLADNADNAGRGLGKATKKAKELKNALLGIDELNIISPPEAPTGGGGAGGIGGGIGDGGSLGFDLPEYDFLANVVETKIGKIVDKMREWLGIDKEIETWSDLFDTRLGHILLTTTAIGVGFAAWKVSRELLFALDKVKDFIKFAQIGLEFKAIGLGLFLADLNEFIKYVRDIADNGLTFRNAAGLISEFTGLVGDSLIVLGNIQLGGALKVIQGIGEIVSGVADIAKSGINWKNVHSVTRGLTNLAIGIGLFTSKLKVVAWGMALQGFTAIITEIGENWEAIKKGDWSGVSKVTLAVGAIEVVGALVVALDGFSKLKGLANVGKAGKAIEEVADTTVQFDTVTSTRLSPAVTNLAKNLGMGLLIIGEVAAGTLVLTGSILLLGKGLVAIGDAWHEVIENGKDVIIGVGLGALVLGGIGLGLSALGGVGVQTALSMGLGTLVLAELGIAAGLFVLEIWGIGRGLTEIGIAWKPVLENGAQIAESIAIGTGLLIGIGVVSAALGVASVASVGLLPVAIGLGTAMLVALSGATREFVTNLVVVGTELGVNLYPVLINLNMKLPLLKESLHNFVNFMGDFAGEIVRYSGSNIITGLAGAIDTIVGWVVGNSIKKFTGSVSDTYVYTSLLNIKLDLANGELRLAVSLMTTYKGLLKRLETLCDGEDIQLSTGMFINMREVGVNLVTGFVAGVLSKAADFRNAGATIVEGFKTEVMLRSAGTQPTFLTWAHNIKLWFTTGTSGVNSSNFGMFGRNAVGGFNNGVVGHQDTSKTSITTWGTNIMTWFKSKVSYDKFYTVASDVVSGFKNGIGALYTTCKENIESWGSSIIRWFKDKLDSNSPSKVFERIGHDTVLGYNNEIARFGSSTKGVVSDWADSFTGIQPTMGFALDTSALDYYDENTFTKGISPNVSFSGNMIVEGFKEAMEEFYSEYLEPMLSGMADDVRKQADKEETTVVNIGNKTVSDAVETQRRANGFAFVK